MSLDRRAFLGVAAASLASSQTAMPAENVTKNKGPQLIIAALAALNRRLQIDEGIARDYLGYLAASGIESVLVNGSTGEFASFSALERKWALEVYLKQKGGAAGAGARRRFERQGHTRSHPPRAGRGGRCSARDPALLLQPADDGRSGALLRTGAGNGPRARAVLQHPAGQRCVSITPELVQRFSSHPRMWGIKDSWGKAVAGTASYIETFPHLAVFTGASALIEGVLKQGGAGALTGNGNIFPRETLEILKAHMEGGDTAGPQQVLNDRVALLKDYPIMPVMKHVLSRMGVVDMHLRPPLTELGPAARGVLNRRLKEAGVIA